MNDMKKEEEKALLWSIVVLNWLKYNNQPVFIWYKFIKNLKLNVRTFQLL